MCSGCVQQKPKQTTNYQPLQHRAEPYLQMATEEANAQIKELKLRLCDAQDTIASLATINKSLKDELRHTAAGSSADLAGSHTQSSGPECGTVCPPAQVLRPVREPRARCLSVGVR